MINIGIDAHPVGDKSGGNETYYKNLIVNLSNKNPNTSYKVYYNSIKNKLENDLTQSKFFKYKNSVIRNLIELPYIQIRDELDLLHVQYFIPPVRLCPVVVTIHDISFEHFDNIFKKNMLSLQRRLIPYAAKHADKIITVSDFSKKDIVDKYKINPNKIDVIHNGISKDFIQLENLNLVRNELSEKYNINGKYILSVGNLQPRKNIERLISVFAKLKRNEANFKYKLVIVGKKAWLFDSIFNKVNENNLIDDVILTDYVSNNDLVKLYNCAELFVYPSLFEGFGLPPLEAMASGTAVITSNTTSLPEVVGSGGIFFDPYDEIQIYQTIKLVLENEEIRKSLINYGLERSKGFSWIKAADETQRVYEEMVNSRESKASS